MTFASRPWGPLGWLLKGSMSTKSWSLIGCVSAERRSISAWEVLSRNSIEYAHMLLVHPPAGHARGDEMIARAADTSNLFLSSAGAVGFVAPHHLLETYSSIISDLELFLEHSGESVVIDITGLPKRFFYPIVKFALRDQSKRNVIVCYTLPAGYAAANLQEDIAPPSHLPTFLPALNADFEDVHEKVLIASVGFESSGLLQVLESDQVKDVHFLFPQPASPPFFSRSWENMWDVLKSTDYRGSNIVHVNTKDVGAAFDRLVGITDGGRIPSVLAPFGPKTISLAMCLFAMGPGADTATVRYTQPKYYNPDYSSGPLRDERGEPVILGYAIRLAGRDLYK